MSKEEKEDIEMKSDSENEEEEEEEEGDEDAEQAKKLKEIDEILAADPYNYQAHVDKIDVLKAMGELEQLREARETFAKCYPLSSDLWLAWVRDEQNLATSQEEKNKVFDLFDRAVKDYVSVDLWLEYCQFSLCGLGTPEGVAKARSVFEKAITAVGIHVAKGALIWEAYREFEGAIFGLISGSTTPDKDKIAQKARIDKLFKRQLTVPLLDMDTTLEEYKTWLEADVDKSVAENFKKTQKMLSDREAFETSLMQTSGEEQLKGYEQYIEFELKEGNPIRIQSIYERRITDHCLVPSHWQEYLDYINKTLKNPDISIPIHERAVRNCPWSGELWTKYIRSLEKYDKSEKDILKVFEQGLLAGFADPTAYLDLWLSYIDFKRRNMKFDDLDDDKDKEEKEKEMEMMRAIFAKALAHMTPLGADPECKAARYWASLEADRFKAMDQARTIWADVLAVVGEKAKFWMEYINVEKMFGDSKHLRKLFQRSLEKIRDWPELVCETWLQFEREEGNLEQFEEAEVKCQKALQKIKTIREKEAETEEETKKRQNEKLEKKKEKDKDKRRERRHQESDMKRENRKRKAEPSDNGPKPKSANVDDGFKAPAAPTPPPGFKGTVAPPPGFKGDVAPPPGFKTENAEAANKQDLTVFVSNLKFSVDEEELKTTFSSSGNVVEVRLVRTPAGKSKGFAYIEFSSVSEAKKALERDNEALEGRPMFISKCDSSKKGHDFKYGVGLEKNKLFVKGLSLSTTQQDLGKIFSQFGKIKDVRLVTYRNGHSKGIAFVEFENASEATSAVIKADGMTVQGSEISVAISNPPERKTDSAPESTERHSRSLGGTSKSALNGPRGKGHTMISFVPRALQVKKPAESESSSNGKKPEAPKSNDQFRAMLLGKK